MFYSKTLTLISTGRKFDSIPACHLRLVCDLYNPMIHTSTSHARGNIACYFQSTHE